MPDIVVARGDGLHSGKDVVDLLMSAEVVLIARGATELDKASGLSDVTLTMPYREGVLLGQLVKYYDSEQEQVVVGKITSISHTIEMADLTTQLKIAVVSDMIL